MTEPTKFFSSVEPKASTRPGARQFVVGDAWDNDGVIKEWNGTAWALPCVDPKDEDEGLGDDEEQDDE